MISKKHSKLIFLLVATFSLGTIFGHAVSRQYFKSETIKINTENKISENKLNYEIENKKTDLTAKEALNVAYSEAVLWSHDVYLSEIFLSSKKFNVAGVSNGWKIVFYSKEKNMLYEILIKDGESREGIEKETLNKMQTMKGELVDSPKLAESFFVSNLEDTEIINLKMNYDMGSKKFIWTIFYPNGSHTIDAEF